MFLLRIAIRIARAESVMDYQIVAGNGRRRQDV